MRQARRKPEQSRGLSRTSRQAGCPTFRGFRIVGFHRLPLLGMNRDSSGSTTLKGSKSVRLYPEGKGQGIGAFYDNYREAGTLLKEMQNLYA